MTRTDGCAHRVRGAAMMWVGLTFLTVLACAQRPTPRVRAAVVRLSPARDFADSVNMVLTRNRPISIAADTMFDTLPGVGDDQRLMVGRWPNSQYGPRAKIQPHRAAADLTEAERDSGVVIARIINLDNRAYAKFNLHARDTVYWWIGRLRGERVSVFISSTPGVRPWVSNLEIEMHAARPYYQPLARWYWDDADELSWGTCDGGRCCKSNGIAL